MDIEKNDIPKTELLQHFLSIARSKAMDTYYKKIEQILRCAIVAGGITIISVFLIRVLLPSQILTITLMSLNVLEAVFVFSLGAMLLIPACKFLLFKALFEQTFRCIETEIVQAFSGETGVEDKKEL